MTKYVLKYEMMSGIDADHADRFAAFCNKSAKAMGFADEYCIDHGYLKWTTNPSSDDAVAGWMSRAMALGMKVTSSRARTGIVEYTVRYNGAELIIRQAMDKPRAQTRPNHSYQQKLLANMLEQTGVISQRSE